MRAGLTDGHRVEETPQDCSSCAFDTLWYIDPDAGIDDPWNNSLAAEPPIYNEDFTQMTVKLREGIYWSDGVGVHC